MVMSRMRWMESAMEYCRMLGLWDYETMKLTSFHNGMIIDVDREKISDIATLFPQRKWLVWEANEYDSNSVLKRDAITNYMNWVISQPMFKHEMDKIIMDYIDFGNCFATVEWIDQRVPVTGYKTQAGYVGPMVRRISPLDIVFNPTAENFLSSPKIVR